MERHRGGSVASERRRRSVLPQARRAGAAALVLLVCAPLAAGAQGARGRSVSKAPKSTRTVVVIQSLEDGRQYAAIVERQRPAFERMDGTLRSGDTEARVAAFLENGDLRLIEERVRYGEEGTARNRYYVSDGRLVYFDSLRVRPRDVGENRLRARDEVITLLAFGEDGRLLGSEKTVNRQPMRLPSTDPPGVLARFESLAGKVAAGGAPPGAQAKAR